MAKFQVALVDLGERLPISTRRLARELGRHLTGFRFHTVEPITPGRMGAPTIEDEWYDVAALFQLLGSHEPSQRSDLVVGITHAKISEQPPSAFLDRRDYFSQSDQNRISVISLNDGVFQYNLPGKNAYQYLAFLIVGELLINLAKQDLMHSETNYCLFDDCANRRDFSRGMEKGRICVGCLAKLNNLGVSADVVGQAQAVLRWCRRTPMRYAAVKTMRNPFTTLSLGTATGWLCKTFLSGDYLIHVLFAAAVIPIWVFLNEKFRSR